MADDVRSIAVDWSFHMARAGQLSHNDAFFSPATHSRLGARSEAENVALNYSVDGAHQALMASPHHHDNLMNPTYRVAGFAVVIDGDGRYWVTEDFVEPAIGRATAAPHVVTVAYHGGRGPGVGESSGSGVGSAPDRGAALLHNMDLAAAGGSGIPAGRQRAGVVAGQAGLLGAVPLHSRPLELAAAILVYLMAFFANRAYSSRRKAEIKAS
jgi:hypothetical protein